MVSVHAAGKPPGEGDDGRGHLWEAPALTAVEGIMGSQLDDCDHVARVCGLFFFSGGRRTTRSLQDMISWEPLHPPLPQPMMMYLSPCYRYYIVL